MELNTYLADRLREVLTEGKWVVGTNFKAQIINLNWKEATTQIEDLNTIAAITFHINYYLNGVNKVFEGGTLDIKDKYSFNTPPIESSEDWQELINEFCENSEKFIQHVEQMNEAQLLSPFVVQDYGSYLRNIDVMIEHTYYHLGQIILIKKKIN